MRPQHVIVITCTCHRLLLISEYRVDEQVVCLAISKYRIIMRNNGTFRSQSASSHHKSADLSNGGSTRDRFASVCVDSVNNSGFQRSWMEFISSHWRSQWAKKKTFRWKRVSNIYETRICVCRSSLTVSPNAIPLAYLHARNSVRRLVSATWAHTASNSVSIAFDKSIEKTSRMQIDKHTQSHRN